MSFLTYENSYGKLGTKLMKNMCGNELAYYADFYQILSSKQL